MEMTSHQIATINSNMSCSSSISLSYYAHFPTGIRLKLSTLERELLQYYYEEKLKMRGDWELQDMKE